MIYLNKALAQRMESCFKHTHRDMALPGSILDIAGGAACFAGPDSFFTQVIAWGFTTKAKQFQSQIHAIEQFYQSLAHSRVDIELCPFVGNELAVLLSQRGYEISELSQVSFLNLNEYQPTLCSSVFEVREVAVVEFENWSNKVAVGFGYLEAQDQFSRYIDRDGVRVFAAYDQEHIIAGATMAVHDDIGDLGVSSTLPAYRGLGTQKHLLRARLNQAKEQGLALAMVTTEPGSISDLNVQKVGFRAGYTRIKMTKTLLR